MRLYPIIQHSKFGFADSAGNIHIACQWDYVKMFDNYGHTQVKNAAGWGLINRKGEQKLFCTFERIVACLNGVYICRYSHNEFKLWSAQTGFLTDTYYQAVSYLKQGGRFRVKLNNKWGILDSKGKELLPCAYDWVERFDKNAARCFDNHKWGLVGAGGQVFMPCMYAEIIPFPAQTYKVCSYQTKEYTIVSQDNYPLTQSAYTNIYKYKNGACRVEKKRKFGYLNAQGREIGDCIFDAINDFEDGLGVTRHNGKWGAINLQGNVRIPYLYERIFRLKEGIFAAKFLVQHAQGNPSPEFHLFNPQGEELARIDCHDIQPFVGDFARMERWKKWGFINSDFQEVQPCQYSEIQQLDSLHYKAKKGHFWGILNQNLQEILPFEYQKIKEFRNGFCIVIKNGYYGVLNANYQLIIPCENMSYRKESPYGISVHTGKGWMYFDQNGQSIYPYGAAKPYLLQEGYAYLFKNDQMGIINLQNEQILQGKYDQILPFEQNLAKVHTATGWGLVDTAGNWVLLPEYEQVYRYEEPFFCAQQAGIWYVFDTKGQKLTEQGFKNLFKPYKGYIFLQDMEYSRWSAYTIHPQTGAFDQLLAGAYEQVSAFVSKEEIHEGFFEVAWGEFLDFFGNDTIQG